MKNILLFLSFLLGVHVTHAQNGQVATEGAWCWFADPRALHYENDGGSINATYIGYIDVHGNVKATQYDWLTKRKTDVLVRSFFQPDDHNNPTFLVLPDERVMIFYTRHTDEPCIWYRISVKPGDITALGEEKRIATANNTTYPSPFILSDDPQHIYLCWRGINWHPTIARLTMPDTNDDCQIDYGPYQMVQSTGARPYAKYASNGKDRIYMAYTTGHPDNEQPNWLYFNVIDINSGNGPLLRDLNGRQLCVIGDGPFRVSKTEEYAAEHPATIIDRTPQVRNWVWQIDVSAGHPVVAYTHIDDAKTSHEYWYARWTGATWEKTFISPAGHAFHQNWDKTERCYSGGMAIDPADTHQLYLSIPTKDGAFDRDGTYEIWRYTLADNGTVSSMEQVTHGSAKGNARPYVVPGSEKSDIRLLWMQGDYFYWMVNKWYPQGYPTAIMSDHDWKGTTLAEASTSLYQGEAQKAFTITLPDGQSLHYSVNPNDLRPEINIGSKTYRFQNRMLTSDNWALHSTGTNGDSHPTEPTAASLKLTYDGKRIIVFRDGFVDQVVEMESE